MGKSYSSTDQAKSEQFLNVLYTGIALINPYLLNITHLDLYWLRVKTGESLAKLDFGGYGKMDIYIYKRSGKGKEKTHEKERSRGNLQSIGFEEVLDEWAKMEVEKNITLSITLKQVTHVEFEQG